MELLAHVAEHELEETLELRAPLFRLSLRLDRLRTLVLKIGCVSPPADRDEHCSRDHGAAACETPRPFGHVLQSIHRLDCGRAVGRCELLEAADQSRDVVRNSA